MKIKKIQNDHSLTRVEIDLKAIKHNLKVIRRLAGTNQFSLPTRPETLKTKKPLLEILTVIKADAYGHGMARIAPLLEKGGVNFFGVSDLTEGIQLRKSGIKGAILLLETAFASSAKEIARYNLIPTVCDLDFARELNQYAEKRKKRINIHVNVDTGMGRLGIWHEQAFDFIQQLFDLRYLVIQGIFTHFPAADTDRLFTEGQVRKLYELVTSLDKKGMVIPYIHAANSMGMAGYRTNVLNLVRPGLILYGLVPDEKTGKSLNLKPVMRVQSQVIFVKSISKGRSISYGRSFISKKEMTVATIPIGYNDGYFRALSNKGAVLIQGNRCPIIGKVTMDQIVVDVTGIKGVNPGTPVTILGTQNKAVISADELARHAKTIHYEIVCSLGNRLPRVYQGGDIL